MNRRLVTRLAAGAAGFAALAGGGSALASAAHSSAAAARVSAGSGYSAGRPSAVTKADALSPQSNIPALDAPGNPQMVAYPPDNLSHSNGSVRVTAPPNTRIVGLDLDCNFSCPVTIAADGRSATGRFESSNWSFVRPLRVYLQADANAPLAGGRFSGSFNLDGDTQPLDVDITMGTQGSPSIFPTNAPSNGGVNVAFVMPGSAADETGLRTGDVITNVNGTPTPNVNAYTAALNGLRSGAIVPVTVRRNGRTVQINLELD